MSNGANGAANSGVKIINSALRWHMKLLTQLWSRDKERHLPQTTTVFDPSDWPDWRVEMHKNFMRLLRGHIEMAGPTVEEYEAWIDRLRAEKK